MFGGFVAVQEPQFAGDGTGVEEIGADGDHDVHIASLDKLLTHLGFLVACAGSLGGHDESGPAAPVQIAVEEADPDIVAVGHLAALVGPRQAERQAGIRFHLPGINLVHVEGRIGHHGVRLAQQMVRIFVVGDGFLDVAFQPVDSQIHLGQADGGGVLFQPVERQAFGGALAVLFHRAGALHEHPAGPAGRIKNDSALGIHHVGDERHQGNRRKKFAVVVGLLAGELGQEIFVNPAKHIARHPLELLRVQNS